MKRESEEYVRDTGFYAKGTRPAFANRRLLKEEMALVPGKCRLSELNADQLRVVGRFWLDKEGVRKGLQLFRRLLRRPGQLLRRSFQ